VQIHFQYPCGRGYLENLVPGKDIIPETNHYLKGNANKGSRRGALDKSSGKRTKRRTWYK
jgi:hypothetical protein